MASIIQKGVRIADSLVRYWSGADRAGKPLQVYFLVTDLCNLRCEMCGVWKWGREGKAREPMETDAVRDFFARCRAASIPTVVISGGEPLLRADIDDVILAASLNFPYVRLQTNGWHLADHARAIVEAGVEELWISVDGTSEGHDAIRGRPGSFDRIERGIAAIREWKVRLGSQRLRLTVQTTVLPHSLDSLVDTVRWAASVGAADIGAYRIADITANMSTRTDEILSRPWGTMQFSSGIGYQREGLPLRLSDDRIRELRDVETESGVRLHLDPILLSPADQRPVSRCLLPWLMMMVGPDGEMVPCHGIDAMRLGSVRDTDIDAVWNGETMRAFRRKALDGFPVCEGCCVPRRRVRDHLKNPENFRRLFPRRINGAVVRGDVR